MRISDWSSDVCSSDLVTPILDGWHGDSSRMYLVGDVPLKARRLVDVTYEAMMRGIEQARPGNHLGDVGRAIERFVAKYRYGIVRDFRSEEHTSELQSLMRISYAVFCLKKKQNKYSNKYTQHTP